MDQILVLINKEERGEGREKEDEGHTKSALRIHMERVQSGSLRKQIPTWAFFISQHDALATNSESSKP